MKTVMKNIFVAGLMIAGLFLQSCDKVEAPYGEPAGETGGTQKVLLEDLTGFHCTNCPDGHRKAKQLQALYGDRLYLLSVHAGFFATPGIWGSPLYTYDFRTAVATEIYNTLTPNASTPKGMVNRVPYPNVLPIETGNWAAAIAKEMVKTAKTEISFDNISYAPTSRVVSGRVEIKFLEDVSEELNIAFYTVEDSIIKPQLDNGVDIEFYNHMHVLRGALNSTWGQSIGSDNSAGSSIKVNFSGTYTPNEAIPEQSFVYAILTNTATKQVIDVEEIKMLP